MSAALGLGVCLRDLPVGGPIPPRERDFGAGGAQRQLEEVQVGAVPRQEDRLSVRDVAADRQRQPMDAGLIVVAALVGDARRRGDRGAERGQLRRRQRVDVQPVPNWHGRMLRADRARAHLLPPILPPVSDPIVTGDRGARHARRSARTGAGGA
jgi:hypothetical protein